MKHFVRTALAVIASVSLLSSCGRKPAANIPAPTAPQSAVLFQSHFIGTTEATKQPGAAKLKEILALPASAAVFEQTLGKLARVPALLLAATPQPAAALPDRAQPIRTLIQELLRSESVIRCYGTTQGIPEWTIAVRLNEEQSRRWQETAAEIAKAWNLGVLNTNTTAGFPGWIARQSPPARSLAFTRAGDWFVLGLGQGPLISTETMLAQLRKTPRSPLSQSSTNWLQIDADLPKLSHWINPLREWHPPVVSLSAVGRGESLRLNGSLSSAQPLVGALPDWDVPIEAIQEPLVSFSAARGIQGWLAKLPAVTRFGLDPLPEQVFGWGQAEVPFQSFLGLMLKNPTNALDQIAARIPKVFGAVTNEPGLGAIRWSKPHEALVWESLPWIVPFVRIAPTLHPRLVLAGIFPTIVRKAPMPKALMDQFIGRKDLAYYEWEVTQPRISHWRATLQLPRVVQKLELHPPEAAGQKWLNSILQPGEDPALRQALQQWPNTISEIVVQSPTQLKFTRNAPLGLSSFELVHLLHWLDAKEFPFVPAPPQKQFRRRDSAVAPATGAPPAQQRN